MTAGTVGVPEMTPVVELRVRPAGSAGCTANDVTAPPLPVGAFGVTGVPTTYAAELSAYERPEGATTTGFVVAPPSLPLPPQATTRQAAVSRNSAATARGT